MQTLNRSGWRFSLRHKHLEIDSPFPVHMQAVRCRIYLILIPSPIRNSHKANKHQSRRNITNITTPFRQRIKLGQCCTPFACCDVVSCTTLQAAEYSFPDFRAVAARWEIPTHTLRSTWCNNLLRWNSSRSPMCNLLVSILEILALSLAVVCTLSVVHMLVSC